MKNLKITLILIISIYKISFSQTKEWNTYDFDSIVSIDMPFDVYEIDTIQNYQKFHQIYSSNDSISFFAQKTYLGKLYSNIETVTLPNDSKGLEKFYSNIISFLSEGIKYNLDKIQPIKYNNLKGYKLLFKNKKSVLIKQINLVLVNKNLYSFTYFNLNGINKADKKIFFNSITFDPSKKLSQFPPKSYAFKIFFISLVVILLLSFFLRSKSNK